MELLHRWKGNRVVHVFEDWAPQKDFIKKIIDFWCQTKDILIWKTHFKLHTEYQNGHFWELFLKWTKLYQNIEKNG